MFEKIYDPESNSYYYWNLKTNEVCLWTVCLYFMSDF